MKKVLVRIGSVLLVVGVIGYAISALYTSHRATQLQLESDRMDSFHQWYVEPILAAAATDDATVGYENIQNAMDYLGNLAIDNKFATKADAQAIMDWYAQKLAANGTLREIMKRDVSPDVQLAMLTVVLTYFVSEDNKVLVLEDLWMMTKPSIDQDPNILKELVPDIPDFFGSGEPTSVGAM